MRQWLDLRNSADDHSWLLHVSNSSAPRFFFFLPEEELLLDEDELAFFLASCKSHALDGLVTTAWSQQVT